MNTLPDDGWKRTALRLGSLSAAAVVVVGITYVIVLALGMALLFAAAALDPARATLRMRRLIQATGVLCLLGLVGPAVWNMRLQLIGVLGYAVMLPLAAFELARWFHRECRVRAA